MNKAKLFSLSRERIWLFAMVLVLATIFAYRPAWNGSFVWDDDFYVTKNRLLTAPDGLRRIWFSLASLSQYFPLTYASVRIERTLWVKIQGDVRLADRCVATLPLECIRRALSGMRRQGMIALLK